MGSGLIALQKPPGRQRTERGSRAVGNRQWRKNPYCLLPIAPSKTGHSVRVTRTLLDNENNQVERAISTGKLRALPRFHIRPIDVVVFHGSSGRNRFEAGFPLRCLQRLSIPYIATLHCGWRHNRSTRDVFTPVLSY